MGEPETSAFSPFQAFRAEVRQLSWTGQHVTCLSLLLVSIPVTASWATLAAPVIVPSTVLVAAAFWHLSRTIPRLSRLFAYCTLGGAAAGAINAGICMSIVTIFSGPSFSSLVGIPMAAIIGLFFGVGYGLGFWPALAMQVSAHGMRRPEGVERCLIGCGLWGATVCGLGYLINARPLGFSGYDHHELIRFAWLAVTLVHTLALLAGLIPWATRRLWLRRVARGKVDGWLLCSPDDFRPNHLDELPIFAKPLLTPSRPPRILAHGRTRDVYRAEGPEPRYLVL
jgi:hypothetical protein